MSKPEIIKVTQTKTHSEKLNPTQIMSIKTRGLSLIVYDCISLDQLSILLKAVTVFLSNIILFSENSIYLLISFSSS